jgi:predicted transcriptional regulator
MQFEEAPSTMQILDAIRDTKSLNLFNAVSLEVNRASDIMIKLSITRKQFYSRISKLLRAGMIKCVDGKYTITAFGTVIYEIQLILGVVIENNSKLENLDLNNSSNEIGMNSQEQVITTKFVINTELSLIGL